MTNHVPSKYGLWMQHVWAIVYILFLFSLKKSTTVVVTKKSKSGKQQGSDDITLPLMDKTQGQQTSCAEKNVTFFPKEAVPEWFQIYDFWNTLKPQNSDVLPRLSAHRLGLLASALSPRGRAAASRFTSHI